MNKTAALAEAHLAVSPKMRTLGDICDALGRARTSSASLGKLLRRHIGAYLIECKVDGVLYLGLHAARKATLLKQDPPRTYHAVANLWRGWLNPATGRRGACLGLGGYESITRTHLGPDK